MAYVFVRNSAGGTNAGTSWGNAFTTIASALSGATSSDIIVVAHDHTQSFAANTTFDPANGTMARPMPILCVNDTANYSDTGGTMNGTLSTGAVLQTTTAGYQLIFGDGSSYWYGFEFKTTSGAVNGYFSFGPASIAGAEIAVFDTCTFTHLSTGSSTSIRIGHAVNDPDQVKVLWLNTNYSCASANNYFLVQRLGVFEWRGGSVSGTVPTAGLFQQTSSTNPYRGDVLIVGVNLNSMGSNPIVGNGWGGKVNIVGCRLGSSYVAVDSGVTWYGADDEVIVTNSDSADSNYVAERHTPYGTVKRQTGIYLTTGGAAQPDVATGTTYHSDSLVSHTTNVPQKWNPLAGQWYYAWVDTTASAKTVSLKVAYDNATVLKDDELYIEVEYMGDNTNNTPLFSFADTVPSNHPIGSGSNLTDTSEAWTGTGAWSNKKTHTLSKSITNQSKGWLRARINYAKNSSSYTIYVDGKVGVA